MSIQTIFLALIALTGAVYDLKSRRIPNWLTFGTLLLLLLINLFQLKFFSALICIAGFVVGLLLLIIPYLLGGMGAGDVKLLGAIGSFVGFKDVILIFIYSGLSGLLLVLIWILFTPGHLKFLITTGQILPAVDKKEKIPYGVAIFLGTILYITFGSGNLFGVQIWQ